MTRIKPTYCGVAKVAVGTRRGQTPCLLRIVKHLHAAEIRMNPAAMKMKLRM
jgi:hypothetical protein